METIFFAIGLLAVVSSCIPLLFSLQFYRSINAYFATPNKKNQILKTSLIVPCKGLDPGFRSNINALFAQTHANFEIIFVTATSDDAAYPVLSEIMSSHPHVPAKLHTAGIVNGRSQKINNQICGLSHIAEDSNVLVFMDSDVRPTPEFLVNLTSPLTEETIGMTTGFRWYLPVKNNFSSFLRSTWNAGGIVFLSNPKANYAWGGAMAIRKETFYSAKVLDYWETALSDDMTISLAVREKKLDIVFIPDCLVVTHEDCTFGEMLEWTNRQTIISKIYHPRLWTSILFAHGIGNIILGIGALLLILCITSFINTPLIFFASIMMLAIVPMEMLNGLLLLPSIIKMLPEHKEKLGKSVLIYSGLAPMASMLALINSVYSLFTNKITWRGITYQMKSPTETIVCGYETDTFSNDKS